MPWKGNRSPMSGDWRCVEGWRRADLPPSSAPVSWSGGRKAATRRRRRFAAVGNESVADQACWRGRGGGGHRRECISTRNVRRGLGQWRGYQWMRANAMMASRSNVASVAEQTVLERVAGSGVAMGVAGLRFCRRRWTKSEQNRDPRDGSRGLPEAESLSAVKRRSGAFHANDRGLGTDPRPSAE